MADTKDRGRLGRRLTGWFAALTLALCSVIVVAEPAEARFNYTLVRPIDFGCPAGTTGYTGDQAAYNCVATYRDLGNYGTGPTIGLRQGNRVFGLTKIWNKHGLTQDTVATVVVNNWKGKLFDEELNRFQYGLRMTVDGIPTAVTIEVYVQQSPDRSGLSPDGYNLGVVTAFCPGYQGLCPPGINEAVAASVLPG